jgi:hypothetical protein
MPQVKTRKITAPAAPTTEPMDAAMPGPTAPMKVAKVSARAAPRPSAEVTVPQPLLDETTPFPAQLVEPGDVTVTTAPPVRLRYFVSTNRRVLVLGGLALAAFVVGVMIARCGPESPRSPDPAKQPAMALPAAPPAATADAGIVHVAPIDAEVVVLIAIDAAIDAPVDAPVDAAPVPVDAATPPPPPPRPDPGSSRCSNLDLLASDAKMAFDANNWASAHALYMKLLGCGSPGALSFAYLAACHAHRFDAAKQLFAQISAATKPQFRAACMRDGFDPGA